MMQDRNGQDSDYLVPGTWYLAPVPHSHISNLNKAIAHFPAGNLKISPLLKPIYPLAHEIG
jgi:hypothetical protein